MTLLNYFGPTFVSTCEARDELDLEYTSVTKAPDCGVNKGRPYGDFGEVPLPPNFIDRPDRQTRRLRFGEVCTDGFIHLKCMKYALERSGKAGRFRSMRDWCLEFRKVLHPDRLFSS
jgi:hypothetical protein